MSAARAAARLVRQVTACGFPVGQAVNFSRGAAVFGGLQCHLPSWDIARQFGIRGIASTHFSSFSACSFSSILCPNVGRSIIEEGIGGVRPFSTRNISGRLFYKKRPKMTPRWKFNPRSKWLEGAPQKKGICQKVHIQTPKKPNSGLRKVCRVRLSNGRVVLAHIPGIGHNLQVHSVVMVRGGRTKDIIGCNYKCMRGRYDLLPTKNRLRARSKHGVKKKKPPDAWHARHHWLTTSVDRRTHFYRTGEELEPDAQIPRSKYPALPSSKPLPQPKSRRMGGKAKN